MLKWGIHEKVNVITVDNASNMTVAINVSGGHILKLGCFAHTLNLAANKVLTIPGFCNVLAKIRSVVYFFHKSNIGTELLKMKQKALDLLEHRLIIDCRTRWNSTYYMLERFLEQRPAILATLLDGTVKRLHDKSKLVSGLSDSEIQNCEDFVKIMQVMETAIKVLSEGKSPTASLILPLLTKLRKHFHSNPEDSTFLHNLKSAISGNLAIRYTDPDVVNFLEEASALDPRTKNRSCISDTTFLEKELSRSVFCLLHSSMIIMNYQTIWI
ncbi:hypothetical protein SNE40_010673 [Patella caerulea]|uniref:Zinc finger BED domain-containing protein 4 n=1 Tax=Patella caerulea TaxID=87958 RepID=A0AAN8JWG8_PATCE